MVGDVSLLLEVPKEFAGDPLRAKIGLEPLRLVGEVFANPLDVSVSSKVSSTVAMSSSSPMLLPSDLTLPFMLESRKGSKICV